MLEKILDKVMFSKWRDIDEQRLASREEDCRIKTREFAYIDDGVRGHLADLYEIGGERGAVINIHGGGLMYGYKEYSAAYCHEYVKRGMAAYNINYRISYDGAKLRDMLADVAAAVEFIVNENKYERYFLTGDSAGAYLAALYIMLSKNADMARAFGVTTTDAHISGLGVVCGMLNGLENDIALQAVRKLAFAKDYKKSDYYKYLNVLNCDLSLLPPTFVQTSADDPFHKLNIDFYNALDALGVKSTLKYYPKERGKRYEHVFAVNDCARPAAQTQLDETVAFFKSIN